MIERPLPGDFVVEPVRDTVPAERFRVRPYASMLDTETFFSDEAAAVSSAVAWALSFECAAFVYRNAGWSRLTARQTANDDGITIGSDRQRLYAKR